MVERGTMTTTVVLGTTMERHSRLAHRADMVEMVDGMQDVQTGTAGLFLDDYKLCRLGILGMQSSGDLKRASSDSAWHSAGPKKQMEKQRKMPECAWAEAFKSCSSAQEIQADDVSNDMSGYHVARHVC